MEYEVWIHKLSFNLNHEIRWPLAVGLTFALLLGAGMQVSRAAVNSRFVSAPTQDRNDLAARRKFEEGESLRAQGTVESLRLAVKKYEEALLLWRAIGARHWESFTLTSIGLVYDSLGEKQKALDYYTQALTLVRAVGDRSGEATTLGNIAYVKRAHGHFDESRSYVESALKIIESLRANVVSKELRSTYFATVHDYYEFYIDLLMRMHKQEPARGYDATALQTSERARARSLIESLTESRADIRLGVDPKLLAQERSLQQRLNAKAEEMLKLSANGADETRLATPRREIDALTVELQQIQTRIRQTSPRYAALKQPQPLTLAEIQQQALDADTLLLEYSLGKERSFLWTVTPTSINGYELPKIEAIEAAARRVYELSSDTSGVRGQAARPRDARPKEAGGQYLAAAAGLSRMLLGPVAGQLGKKRLVIVADGMLHYTPFGALPDPNSLKESDGSWQPLLVEHEIVNLPSASTIAVLRRELAGRKPAARTLADSERPELSTIVLSLFDEQGRPQDGFLRPHEVYNLNLPAEMVTLSACETGLGKLTRGEGLVSLTRGFMYAGAARVVVSLWSVNDRATAELMTKFYRRALVEG